jgi:hypothetical protein
VLSDDERPLVIYGNDKGEAAPSKDSPPPTPKP